MLKRAHLWTYKTIFSTYAEEQAYEDKISSNKEKEEKSREISVLGLSHLLLHHFLLLLQAHHQFCLSFSKQPKTALCPDTSLSLLYTQLKHSYLDSPTTSDNSQDSFDAPPPIVSSPKPALPSFESILPRPAFSKDLDLKSLNLVCEQQYVTKSFADNCKGAQTHLCIQYIFDKNFIVCFPFFLKGFWWILIL